MLWIQYSILFKYSSKKALRKNLSLINILSSVWIPDVHFFLPEVYFHVLTAIFFRRILAHRVESSSAICGGPKSRQTSTSWSVDLSYLKDRPYPINEPLVEVLHGSLELAALMLPLFIVSHRLLSGPLPCCRSCYVVNIIHPTHWVHSSFPTKIKQIK